MEIREGLRGGERLRGRSGKGEGSRGGKRNVQWSGKERRVNGWEKGKV